MCGLTGLTGRIWVAGTALKGSRCGHRQWGQTLGDTSVKTINAQFGLSSDQHLQPYTAIHCQTHLFYQHNGGLAPSPCAQDLASVLVSPAQSEPTVKVCQRHTYSGCAVTLDEVLDHSSNRCLCPGPLYPIKPILP